MLCEFYLKVQIKKIKTEDTRTGAHEKNNRNMSNYFTTYYFPTKTK